MPVARYLALHYRTTGELATACGVTSARLDALLDAGLVPAPSYRVERQGTLESVVFGRFDGTDAAPGAYFHRGTSRWVQRALRAVARLGMDAAAAHLRADFERRFAGALGRVDRGLIRLEDCFDSQGVAHSAAVRARCELAWGYLMDGTFGLCVRHCASVHAIARKEMLQEYLTRRAAQDDADLDDVDHLRALLQLYADAAMPFALPEYPASSRKRLVDDFGARLGALHTTRAARHQRVPVTTREALILTESAP